MLWISPNYIRADGEARARPRLGPLRPAQPFYGRPGKMRPGRASFADFGGFGLRLAQRAARSAQPAMLFQGESREKKVKPAVRFRGFNAASRLVPLDDGGGVLTLIEALLAVHNAE